MEDFRPIGFNKPFLTGNEIAYIQEAVNRRKLSGNGHFTQKCHSFFENRYGFKKCLLTTSCTDALEMAALLMNIQPGDEVIMPSYTFVSTANAFVLRGAKIVFADSHVEHPGVDEDRIEDLVTSKTRAIIVVHYAGFSCDMDKLAAVASRHNLFIVEDAAQAIDSFYHTKALGSIGHIAAFSFHETKNIISGEGGMLVINDERLVDRAEKIWEKGTNRLAFFRGEVDKYNWVDVGSSFLPSEIIAAFLFSQLEHLDVIQRRRKLIWENYWRQLTAGEKAGYFRLPYQPPYATNNYHMFYLVCHSLEQRTRLIEYLKDQGINAVFHYQSLHKSPYYASLHDGRQLTFSDMFSDCLVRLPFYYEITSEQQTYIVQRVLDFFRSTFH
ncbi:MAG TPA: dTDP-4-amino-4,6-dideoxygalactose transaminase [Chryseosolibacter sp.]